MRESVRATAAEMKELNEIALKGETVIFGSTYMRGFPFYELVNRCQLADAVYNRSIDGLTLAEAREVLTPCVLDLKPRKIFLCLGENEYDSEDAVALYRSIISDITEKLPSVKIYVIELPCREAERFNQQVLKAIRSKNIVSLALADCGGSRAERYKEQFRQIAHFLRNGQMTLTDVFAVANL